MILDLNPNAVILQLLNGLVVGSSIALVASGLALLFGVLHIINFAQGDFFMLGAYSVFYLLQITGNYFLSALLGTLLVGIVGGLALTLIVWPLLQRSQVLTLLATLGLSLILQQSAVNILGGDAKLVKPPLEATVAIGPVNYPLYWLVVLVVGLGVLVLGSFALKYTKYGIWLRAVAQNRSMAAALGVPVPRVFILAFIICTGLAALAGTLLVPLYAVYPTVGVDVILTAFIVVVAGGMGNLKGAAIIAILVGEVQSLGSLIAEKPSVVQVTLFALVIVLLMVRSRRQSALVRL
jgi:branched-subunit amino acid ABC-type transport system permease component